MLGGVIGVDQTGMLAAVSVLLQCLGMRAATALALRHQLEGVVLASGQQLCSAGSFKCCKHSTLALSVHHWQHGSAGARVGGSLH